MDPMFIRGMQYAIDQLWAERDTYLPRTASWRALDNAARRLCARRDRMAERGGSEKFRGFVAEDSRRIDQPEDK